MEKESVDEAFSRLKLADSWEKRGYKSSIKGFGGIDIEAAYASSFAPNTVSIVFSLAAVRVGYAQNCV